MFLHFITLKIVFQTTKKPGHLDVKIWNVVFVEFVWFVGLYRTTFPEHVREPIGSSSTFRSLDIYRCYREAKRVGIR